MSRPLRANAVGYVYHVLNRANGRLRIFKKNTGFEAFEKILAEVIEDQQREKIQKSLARGSPFGAPVWLQQTAQTA